MKPDYAHAALALMLVPATANADQITADRPGIGSDPEVVPQFTVQGEVGTDSREIRLGIFQGFEVDRDDSSWAGKLALANSKDFKLSLKVSYDHDLHTIIELPANYTFNSLFNLGATVIWSRSMQTYAGEFNITPTKRLTITPTLYYESKVRAAIFAAWVLPKHDNIQLDIGYDQHQVNVGISASLDLKRLVGKR